MNRALEPSCGRAAGYGAHARRSSTVGVRPVLLPVKVSTCRSTTRSAPFRRLHSQRSGPVAAGALDDRSSSVPPGGAPPGLPRSPNDDGSTQITLLLSMSVSLLLLPWVARHPTFLIGLPLLAVTPVVGQGVRPILREALTSVLKGLRLGGALLPHPHDDPTLQGSTADAHHAAQHLQQHAHGAYPPASPWPRKDPRTVPHGPSAHVEPVEPSGPYSEWRPPAERRASSDGFGSGGTAAAAAAAGGSPGASRDGGSGGVRRPQARVPQPQGAQQQQQQQVHHHSHHHPSSASRDNLESLEEEEEALWAAAAASLQLRGANGDSGGSPGGSPGGSFSAGAPAWQDADAAAGSALGSRWQARDPRVLSRDEKLQRLARRQQSMQP